MATVESSFKIFDAATSPLEKIVRGFNLAIAAMESLQDGVDQNENMTQTFSAARSAISEAEAEIRLMTEAQEKLNDTTSKLAPPPPPEWVSEPSVDLFHSSGLDRFIEEVNSAKNLLQDLQQSQKGVFAADMSFLPPNAQPEIVGMNQRVTQLAERFHEAVAEKERLADRASPEALLPLNNAIEKMRQQLVDAVQEQNNLNDAMKRGDLSGVHEAYRRLNKHVNSIESGIRDNIVAQDQFNKSVKDGTNFMAGLLKKAMGFAAAYFGINATKGFLTESWIAASGKTGAEQRLQSIMSNIQGMTQDGIDMLKQYAQELEEPLKVGADVGIMGMSQLGEYVYDPDNIKALTKSMYNLATETYGVGFSAENLLQTSNLIGKVMMGDINALSRNGFKIDAIFDEAEQKLLKTGTEAERTALVIQMIEENLDGLAESMAQTPEGKLHGLRLSFGAIQEKIGFGLIPTIDNLYDVIMDNMPMIEVVFTNVFSTLFNLFDKLIILIGNVARFFIDNWSWIEPVIWGIVSALSAYLIMTKGVTVALRIAAIAQAIFNAIMNMNPFVFVATLIVGLIAVLIRLWQTNDKFAAGLMRAWNAILNFFDRVPIFFVKVGYGIINAFQDMKVKSLEIIDLLVNGVIDGVNSLIEKLNKIPGVSLDAIEHVEFSAKAAAEAEAIRQAGEDAIALMENKAAKKAEEREQKVLDMLENRAAKRAAEEEERNSRFEQPPVFGAGGLQSGMWDVDDGTLENIDKVGEVGKIRDKVDISSEDLKTMRELAEMKNIQNFVTLTPTVSMTHTGNINNGYDIETIISRIEQKLEEEFISAAEGVYT